MSEPKTKKTKQSVSAFINTLKNEEQKRNARELVKMMKDITGKRPVMWGSSIVGFGTYHYKYKSGREGDWPITGFSPRKNTLSIYIMPGFKEYDALLKKLGPHKNRCFVPLHQKAR